MKKRIFGLLACVLTLILVLAGCAAKKRQQK